MVGIQQKLHRARAAILNTLRHRQRGLAHTLAQRGRHTRRRSFLDHFLMAALYRAITLEQVNAIAETVHKHLYFHMARADQVFLNQQAIITKRRACFAPGGGDIVVQRGSGEHDTHAFTATAGTGFQQQRITDAFGLGAQAFVALLIAVIAGHQRHTAVGQQGFGAGLIAHGFNRCRRRADKGDAGLFAGTGKGGVFA